MSGNAKLEEDGALDALVVALALGRAVSPIDGGI